MKIIPVLLLLFNTPAVFAQEPITMTVFFDFNEYVVTASAAKHLDLVVGLLPEKKDGLTISLYGHCDSIGSHEYNDQLSKKRIDAVKNYLLGKGLGPAFIVKEEALGKRHPLVDNTDERSRSINRRVELIAIIPEEKPVQVTEPIATPVEKTTIPPVERSLEKTIQDTAVKAGSKIILKNLNFYGGRDILMEISEPALLELLQVMTNNPKLVIRIDGHICCQPGDMDGTDLATGVRNLSEARAKAVYNYLVRKGIARSRLSYIGWAHRNPIFPYPETSEKQRTLNRRVEIMIVSK